MTKHEQWIEDIRSAEGAMGGIKLSQWEEEFMESIEKRLEENRQLTTAQAETLEKIWDRV